MAAMAGMADSLTGAHFSAHTQSESLLRTECWQPLVVHHYFGCGIVDTSSRTRESFRLSLLGRRSETGGSQHLETLMTGLANGSACFEYVHTNMEQQINLPFASISSAFSGGRQKKQSLFFARIGLGRGGQQTRQGTSQALKKVEHFTVRKIAGDGRCMFRALVQGMALNKGLDLNSKEEEQEADQLRFAVMDAICRSDKRRRMYEEALIAITVEESLKRYCQRIPSSNFWGGESELLVLSRMCSQPVFVYIPESEVKQGARWGTGYIPIAEYGAEFVKPAKDRKARKPVRLLYNGSNHYDLLI